MDDNFAQLFRDEFQKKQINITSTADPEHYYSLATRLMKKKRELDEVDAQLAAKREDLKIKMELVQERRDILEKKELELKETLFKYDTFLKENETKKARALQKANSERDTKRRLIHDLEILHKDLENLLREKEESEMKLEKYAASQNYFHSVIMSSTDFQTISDIKDRYHTLISARQHLSDKIVHQQKFLEKQKLELNQFKEEKNNEILGYGNELATLQVKLEQAQNNAIRWESIWTHIQNTAANKVLNSGRMRMAIYSMYKWSNKEQGETIAKENTTKQLEKIEHIIQDLTQITKEIKREEAAKMKTRIKSKSK